MELAGKRRKFSSEFKLLAIETAERTSNRKAAKAMEVDEKRIREWRKQKDELQAMDEQTAKNKFRVRRSSTSKTALSPEQVSFFNDNGFLVLPSFFSAKTVRSLEERIQELLEAWAPEQLTVFTTKEQNRVSDEYFMESGDKIRFFLEENVLNPDKSLKYPKDLCVNKIGHCWFILIPVGAQAR
jgi:hypothetical protein